MSSSGSRGGGGGRAAPVPAKKKKKKNPLLCCTFAATPKDYLRRSVFLPFLDQLLTELRSRFSAMTKAAVGGLRLLPKKAKTMDVERVRADLLQAYEVDLPKAEHLRNYTPNSEKCISAHRNFQNFPAEHAPGPPRGGEGKLSRDRYAITGFGVLEFHTRDSNPGSATDEDN